jgi:hypothetical protein
MSLAELLPGVRRLPRGDKLTLLRQLSDDLATEDLIPPGEYPVWSQIDAYEAAATMQAVLDASKGQSWGFLASSGSRPSDPPG